MHFLVVFSCIMQPATCDGISGRLVGLVVPGTAVKFGDPGFNRSHEI